MSRVGDALTMSSLRNNFEDNRRRNCCTAVDGGDCAEVSEEFLLAASSFHSITVSESYSSSLESQTIEFHLHPWLPGSKVAEDLLEVVDRRAKLVVSELSDEQSDLQTSASNEAAVKPEKTDSSEGSTKKAG
ncbi:hypothetical protein HPP92_005277 [Vanilla planifolia]|uniref:Uncharacterized protein n=1 Tax=Vanilla planifolia TaxID=51239 RepID=A0A835RYG4_VANPL|nr:hypothetical protein HPP92_005277 [Vanilla planifolia]